MTSPVNSYLSAVEKHSYEDAKGIYNAEIKWQVKKEVEFEKSIKDYIQKVLSDYKSNKIDFSKANSLLDTIIKSDVMVSEAIDAQKKITALNDSRIAYKSAENLEVQNNVEGALLQYNSVIEEDENYQKAQDKITSLKQQYKTQVLNKAKSLSENKDFAEAIKVLENALSIFAGDVELSAAYKLYEYQNVEYLKQTQEITVEKAYLYKYGSYINFYGLSAIVKNNSSKVVKDFEVGLLAFDKDGYPLKIDYDGVLKKGRAEACNIQPGKTFGDGYHWSLYNDNEDKIKTVIACIIRCTYYDETTWENSYYQYWLEQYKEKALNRGV